MANFITEGIVLKKINYSETSLILQMLTADSGLQSFIFQGAKRKHKKGQIIGPLSVLDITYFKRKDSDLAKISQVDLNIIFKSIPTNPIKQSLIFFINEVLVNSIQEEEYNPQLYQFLKQTVQIIDHKEELGNFAVKFLMALLIHLGYYPDVQENGTFFDFMDGKITKNEPNHPYYLGPVSTKFLITLMSTPLKENGEKIPQMIKKDILNGLLDYYKIKIDGFKPLKSLDVLETVLS